MQAGRWLLTGLVAAAVAGGLVMGDLTASAIDPRYREVGARVDESVATDPYPRTQPAPIAFTPIRAMGEWPDAAPPPPDENVFHEPVAIPTYDQAEPPEPALTDPEPVAAVLSDPSAPKVDDQPSSISGSVAVIAESSVESVPPGS